MTVEIILAWPAGPGTGTGPAPTDAKRPAQVETQEECSRSTNSASRGQRDPEQEQNQIGQTVPQTGQWAIRRATNRPRLGNQDPN